MKLIRVDTAPKIPQTGHHLTLGVMQPYLFPYLGYFQLIAAVDRFVLYDDVNYIKKGWINRNRVLLNGAPHTFTVPVRDVSQNRTIRDHFIAMDGDWRQKLLANLRHAYAKAPLFSEVFPAIEAVFMAADGSIADLAEASIRLVATRVGLSTDICRASDLVLPTALKGQDRILAICAHHNAARYINPADGAGLYDGARFAAGGVSLRFLRMDPDIHYPQIGTKEHVSSLSIIDVLMHNAPEELIALLSRYRLFSPEEFVTVGPEEGE